jgi:hypothetical protein
MLDEDFEVLSGASSAAHFGNTVHNKKELDAESQHSSYNDLSEMFNQARNNARRATASIGGRNDFPNRKKRSKTPNNNGFEDIFY